MHYVKQFHINGVDTKQVACIELHGKPNAATEGYVGVLGIDVDSPLHDVYKCAAVNGSIYTWELLSSGLSLIASDVSGSGAETVEFPYEMLKTPSLYVVKIGDTILDGEGYLYQVASIGASSCVATYCGIHIVKFGMSAYGLAGGFMLFKGNYPRVTVPSEQITSVAGTREFQASPLVTAFHCSTVPSKVMDVRPVQP